MRAELVGWIDRLQHKSKPKYGYSLLKCILCVCIAVLIHAKLIELRKQASHNESSPANKQRFYEPRLLACTYARPG